MKKKATKKTIAPKEIIASKKIIERNRVPAFLSRKYMQDCEASLIDFPDDKKVEFLEHLLECFDIIEKYLANPTPENYKIYANKENTFLKKHGKRLKMYQQTRMYLYYADHHVLVEKDIYTNDEWNGLGKEQRLNADEYAEFIDLCRNRLYLERDFFLLRQSPEDERKAEEKNKSKELSETLSGASNLKNSRIKRGAYDNMTSLSQEQTILLTHYLKLKRVFLNGEHLNDTEAGKALSVLTGYSYHSLRQNIKEFENYETEINLKEIYNLLTEMQKAIKADLEGV
ncbi:MAG: hypothetical protein ACYDCN_00330 [Bacteroidia bacterium]